MKPLEPKSEFIHTPEAAVFAELLSGEAMRTALHVALEQFVMDQLRQDTFEAAAKLQYELQGAKRFISILLNITTPDTAPTQPLTGNLQWPKPKPPRRQGQSPTPSPSQK